MDPETFFESGKFADFTFVDTTGNELKAHRSALVYNKYFDKYFNSPMGEEIGEKTVMNVSNINVIRPIIRFLYCGATDKFSNEVSNFDSSHELMEFYSVIDMWEIKGIDESLYNSIISSLDLIITEEPKYIPTIIRIASSLLNKDQLGDICLSIMTQAGDCDDIPDEILVDKILPHLSKNEAIKAIKSRKKPELLIHVLNKGFESNKIAIIENKEEFISMAYEDGTPIIPHKSLSRLVTDTRQFVHHYAREYFLSTISKGTIYVAHSLFHPWTVTKYKKIGAVHNKIDAVGRCLTIGILPGSKLKPGDTIGPMSSPCPNPLTIETIFTEADQIVTEAYPGFTYKIQTQPNDLCAGIEIVKITENWGF